MPKICYVPRSFSAISQGLIDKANEIINEYEEMGYELTLRQLYYQMVSRDIIANKQAEYKRLGSVVNDARLAGLIDWDRISDLTRELRSVAHWDDPSDIVGTCARQFRIDKWAGQTYRPEVWVEKDALRNVIERACTPLDVSYFSCRGYTSQSEMWSAAQRLLRYKKAGQTPIILHFGDHDPSGIDMTRDIRDRLAIFGLTLKVDRLALNMDQVEEYSPPPNPAKTTDSRYAGYIAEYGDESWELDALDPTTLAGIIENAIKHLRDEDEWGDAVLEEETHRELLSEASNRWEDVASFLSNGKS
jgi:hypothetical protein